MDIKRYRSVGTAFSGNSHLRVGFSFNFDLWVKGRPRVAHRPRLVEGKLKWGGLVEPDAR